MEQIMELYSKFSDYGVPVMLLIITAMGLKSAGYKIVYKICKVSLKWIKELEMDDTLSGKEKMDTVVSYVKTAIPRVFKIVFSDKVIESISQSVYDDMKAYSDNRIASKLGMNWSQVVQTIKESETNKVEGDNTSVDSIMEAIDWLGAHGFTVERNEFTNQ